MAEAFSTVERPLGREDFRLISVGPGDDRRAAVILSAGNGLSYGGTFDSLISDDRFVIENGGELIDTRAAMTWDAYQAFIGDAKPKLAGSLPDSLELTEQNGRAWTATWLTGEPADEFGARCGRVVRGEPGLTWYNRFSVWSAVRVRPIAVLKP